MRRLCRITQTRAYQTAQIHCRDVFVWDKSEWKENILRPSSAHAAAYYAQHHHFVRDPNSESEFCVGFTAVSPVYLSGSLRQAIEGKEAEDKGTHRLLVFPDARLVDGLTQSDVKTLLQQLEDPSKQIEREGSPLSQIHLFMQTLGLGASLNSHQQRVAEWAAEFVQENKCDWCVWEASEFAKHRQAATVLIMPNQDVFAHWLTKDAVYRACEAVLKDATLRP